MLRKFVYNANTITHKTLKFKNAVLSFLKFWAVQCTIYFVRKIITIFIHFNKYSSYIKI